MKDYTKLLNEFKKNEDTTLRDILIFSLVCFAIDLFHLKFHYHFPEYVRNVYFTLFFICFYVLSNRFHRRNRIRKELANSIGCLKKSELELIFEFAKNQTQIIELTTTEQYQSAIALNEKFEIINFNKDYIYIDEPTYKIIQAGFLEYWEKLYK